MGRPSSFTQETADAICARVAEGETLRVICGEEGMPARSTVHLWLRDNQEFSDQYARAREVSAGAMEEELLAEAKAAVDGESAQVARVRVDALKWVMSKRAPKVYGDKQQINATVDGTINVVTGVPRAG